MKILLTGKSGQLGAELATALEPVGEVVALDRTQLDLAAPDRIVATVRSVGPDVLINAAAYTAVDRAESEPAIAYAVNAKAVEILAQEAKRIGTLLVHYSTDYVFDGAKSAPYVEEDAPGPLNVYGRSKLAGEEAIQSAGGDYLILRTSWVYAMHGKNFLMTIRRLLAEKKELRVVCDQIGAPTLAGALARATADLLQRHGLAALRERRGIYHATASGSTSWHGFASEIAKLEGAEARVHVVPIPTDEYPTPARRPKNSRLCSDKLLRQFGVALPSWETSLRACYAA